MTHRYVSAANFAARYGLIPAPVTGSDHACPNRLLRQRCARAHGLTHDLCRFWDGGEAYERIPGLDQLFDHCDLWKLKSRRSDRWHCACLTSQPYYSAAAIEASFPEAFAFLRGLGFVVLVSDASWYGSDTCLVEVWAPGIEPAGLAPAVTS